MSVTGTGEEAPIHGAWLERGDERIALSNPCHIGRSTRCHLVIASERVSREHAILQFNDLDLCWMLIDLGSTNGTQLNGQRVGTPAVLRSGDRIAIGDESFVFREDPRAVAISAQTVTADRTVLAIGHVPCWLALADIKGSTQLVQELSANEMSERVRLWARECEGIVRETGGLVNEYLGDGLLAFWRDGSRVASQVAEALRHLAALESESGLRFRVICHYGEVNFGAGLTSGLEKLSGREVTFLFKLEKLACLSDRRVSLTQPAATLLRVHCAPHELGAFPVPGFPGTHPLYEPRFP